MLDGYSFSLTLWRRLRAEPLSPIFIRKRSGSWGSVTAIPQEKIYGLRLLLNVWTQGRATLKLLISVFYEMEAICLLPFLQAEWDHETPSFPHSCVKCKVVREWGKDWGPGWVRSQGWVLIFSLWQGSECIFNNCFPYHLFPMTGSHTKIMYFKNMSF